MKIKKRLQIKLKYLRLISNGLKTLEARANYSSLSDVKVGNVILFFCDDLSCLVRVKAIRHHKNVITMLNNEDIKKLLPGCDYNAARLIYNKIYPQNKVEANGGMLVFEVEKI